MSALISRDPFAREEIHREVVHSLCTTCRFCGGTRHVRRDKCSSLFRYWVETDGGTKHEISGVFCSIGCMRSYHG